MPNPKTSTKIAFYGPIHAEVGNLAFLRWQIVEFENSKWRFKYGDHDAIYDAIHFKFVIFSRTVIMKYLSKLRKCEIIVQRWRTINANNEVSKK